MVWQTETSDKNIREASLGDKLFNQRHREFNKRNSPNGELLVVYV